MDSLEQFSIDLRETAKSLRAAGNADLARQLSRAVKDAAEPVLLEIRAELPEFMPVRYAGVLARDLLLTSGVRMERAGARVTLRAGSRTGKRRSLRRLNRGVLAHPLFGNKLYWFNQVKAVEAGFFSRPATDAQEEFRDHVKAAMDKVADDAARRTVT